MLVCIKLTMIVVSCRFKNDFIAACLTVTFGAFAVHNSLFGFVCHWQPFACACVPRRIAMDVCCCRGRRAVCARADGSEWVLEEQRRRSTLLHVRQLFPFGTGNLVVLVELRVLSRDLSCLVLFCVFMCRYVNSTPMVRCPTAVQ